MRKAAILGLVGAVIGLGLAARYYAGAWLVRDDAPAAGAPFIALLMGTTAPVRADQALALLAASPAARLVMVRERPFGFVAAGVERSQVDVVAAYLMAKGVASDRIQILEGCASASTLDEARCMLAFARNLEPRPARLPVVTSWYHTSRAGWLFDKTFADSGIEIEMAPALSETSRPEGWLESEDSFISVYNEYLKWVYWLGKL